MVNSIDYNASGLIVHQTDDTITIIFGWTGQETDPESDFYHFDRRPYDPRLQVFAATDPIAFAADDPNLYRYVGNSPTNYTDPTGLEDKLKEDFWYNDSWRDYLYPWSWMGYFGNEAGVAYHDLFHFMPDIDDTNDRAKSRMWKISIDEGAANSVDVQETHESRRPPSSSTRQMTRLAESAVGFNASTAGYISPTGTVTTISSKGATTASKHADGLTEAVTDNLPTKPRIADDVGGAATVPRKATTPPDPAHPPGSLGAAKAWSLRSRYRAANLPNQGRIRYVPPEHYNPATPFPRGPQNGYLDRFGNEWVWDPVKGEWDVQLSRTGKAHLGWLSNSGNHVNISPVGEVTH